MRELWTEDDILALASEESNDFDRKSGRLLDKESNLFFNDLAKALSAFANSGGGSIVLGVEDDGTITGLDERRGATATKDWIEQKIPALLSYQLSLFRIHTVIPNTISEIPVGQVVIVIEIGDSPAAPHQSNRDKKYYYRSGGRSEPASHFYLELLRQRLTSPTLKFEFYDFKITHVQNYQDGLFVEATLTLNIINTGNVAAYKWEARVVQISTESQLEIKSYIFVHRSNFPITRSVGTKIPLDTTILPGLNRINDIEMGFFLPSLSVSADNLEKRIADIMLPTIIGVKLATETSRGEMIDVALVKFISVSEVVKEISKKLNS